MRLTRVGWMSLAIVLGGLSLHAQDHKNEMAFTLGVEFVPDHQTRGTGATIESSRSIVFGASYGRRLIHGAAASLFLEIPFSAAPSHRLSTIDPPVTQTSMATLFVTPSLQVKFAPSGAVAPWVSGGFGWAFLEGAELLPTGAPNPDRRRHTAAAQFGAGADIRTPLNILAPISLRAEFRDFYSFDTLSYGVPVRAGGEHHLVLAGGFLLRF